MNYFNKFLYLTAVVAASFLFTFCSDDDDNNVTPTPTEYVATNSTFSGWNTWTLIDSTMGPDPTLGAAHGGNDSNVTRKIYMKEDKAKVTGQYPIGTGVTKHVQSGTGETIALMAMVKRGGNGFNTEHNGWEWFALNSDGTINEEARGANLMDGMCNSCHSGARMKDYVFSKD